MKKLLLTFLIALFPLGASAQLNTFQGGTGTTSPSGILYGDSTIRLKTLTIGSGLLFSAGTLSAIGGSGNVATSSAETAGYLPYWTTTSGTPAKLGKVATTSVTCSGDASCTPFTVIGDSPITISATAGAGGDWATTSEAYYWLQNRDWKIDTNGSLTPTSTIGVLMGNATTSNATTTNLYVSGTTRLASLSGLLKATTGVISVASSGTDYEVPLTFGDGLTRTSNDVDVDTTQNIAKLSNLTGNGFVKTSGGDGTLSVDTTTYESGLTAGDGLTRTANDFDCDTANSSTFGCLTSADWTTFNNKQVQVTGTYPITVTGLSSNVIGLAFGTTTNNTWSGTNTFTGNVTMTNATSTNLGITSLTSALVKVDANGSTGEYAGTSCTNQFVRSLSALGVATCETVQNADLANSTISGIALGSNLANLTATDSTLTFSGTYNGGTARTIGLNLGNANTWTGGQTFTNATTTAFAITSIASKLLKTNANGSIVEAVSGTDYQPAGTYLTSVSVASANGFAGSSSGGATPALTLSTSITGVLKGNGTAISAAANGTDYTLLTATTCGAGEHVSAVTASGAVTCSADSGATFANPSATIGLTANNGVATTAMRSDATPALSQAIVPTWTGLHTFSNTTNAASNQLAVFQSARSGSAAANDEGYISFKLKDGDAAQSEFARITAVGTDVGVPGLDGALDFSVVVNNTTLTKKLRLAGSVLSPSASDGTALGSTALQWSDLFLASGGVINFNNGASTITHSSPLGESQLTVAGSAGLVVSSPGTQPGSVVTIDGTQTLTNKTISTATLSGVLDAGGATSFELPNGTAPTVDTDGECAIDTTSGQLKCDLGTNVSVIGNGNFYPSFTYATSTAWTGTTTIPLGPAYIGETWNGVKCFTDTGTVGVSFYDGTNRMTYIPTASTTVGTVTLSTNNTFMAGEKRYVDIGTPASSPTKISCTVSKSYTAD